MTSLVEQTAKFLPGNRPSVQEKSLSDAEIEDLLDKGKEVATSISKDTKKSEEDGTLQRMFWVGSRMCVKFGTKITHFIRMQSPS